MTIGQAAVRTAVRGWAESRRETLEALQRALAIVHRDHPGASSVEDLIVELILGVAGQHVGSVEGAMSRLDSALLRLLEDVDSMRGGALEIRPAAEREADLRAIAEAMDQMVLLEDRVHHDVASQPQELQDQMRAALEEARTPPPAPAAAAATAAAVLPTVAESRRRGQTALDWGQEVLNAYASGRTLERPPTEPKAVAPHPELTARLERLQQAMRAYRDAPHASPAAAQRAAERLREQVSEANEVLRSWGRRFESAESGAHVPTRPRPGAAPGSVDARTIKAGRAVKAQAGLATGSADDLFRTLAVDEPVVRGWGVLSEPLARDLPGVGLESFTPSPETVRGWKTDPPWLAARLADLLTTGEHPWERAHLIGPGFGGELFAGLMLTPRGVNQVAQNQGIESFLRYAADLLDSEVRVDVEVHGRRMAVPLADDTFEHLDVMESVHYRVPTGKGSSLRTRDGQRLGEYLTFDIWVEPDGTWRIKHNLPAGALDPSIPMGGHG